MVLLDLIKEFVPTNEQEKRDKEATLKYRSKIILFTIVIIIATFILSSCNTSKTLLINLITKSETSDEIEYVSVYSNGKSKKIDPFISDHFQVYNADQRSFSSYIANNTVLNKLNNIVLKDSDGNIVDNDEIITGIFQSAEKLEHDIWEFQVFKVLESYYVLVKLNVNWQSPCDFYEYDSINNELKLLNRFQGIDIIGISLPKDS